VINAKNGNTENATPGLVLRNILKQKKGKIEIIWICKQCKCGVTVRKRPKCNDQGSAAKLRMKSLLLKYI
jgi:hypothetical protein